MRQIEKFTFLRKEIINRNLHEETLLFVLCHKINLNTEPAHCTVELVPLFEICWNFSKRP